MITACFLEELWNLPATGFTFLSDVSLLEDADQYLSCDDGSIGSVGSVVLNDNRLNTATVAYYNGATPGSTACFVYDRSSGYELNATTTAERVCQSDGLWSGSPIVCGMSTCINALLPDPCRHAGNFDVCGMVCKFVSVN